jgi:hypothetical protein
VLAVSPWLEDHDDEYRDHLLAVSVTGDFAPWIEFFARAVRDESRSAQRRITALLALKDEMTAQAKQSFPRARLAVEIVENLIAYPVLSVGDSHRRHGRTDQANRNAIGALVDVGLLEPYTAARYDRLYWAPRVFKCLSP